MALETMAPFKFELDSIVRSFSSYPTKFSKKFVIQANRQGMNLAQVEVLVMANKIGPEILSLLVNQQRKARFTDASRIFLRVEAPKHSWDRFCSQIGSDDQLPYIHPFWRLFLVSLWNENNNIYKPRLMST